MESHYLIANPRQRTWGRGETIKEALEKCQFTSSQDIVRVFLTDSTGHVTESGTVVGRFVTDIGCGKVRADKKGVTLNLEGEAPVVRSIDECLVERIHETLDGTEWDSDHLMVIANLLSDAGFAVREVGDVD